MNAIRRLVSFYALQVRLIFEWRGGARALLGQVLLALIIATISFLFAAAITPRLTVDSVGAVVVAVIVLGLLNWLIRPLIVGLGAAVSVVLLAILSVAFQVVVFLALNALVPGIHVEGVIGALVASIAFAAANMVLATIFMPDQLESYYGVLIRRLAAQRPDRIVTDQPGVLVVQIDGLPHPVLQGQIRAGRVPTISRWIRSGSHRLDRWTSLVPSTTPAGQAGILHGNNDGIVNFRWYERDTGQILVANHPADAAQILTRISNGQGLLSNDGASVGNLFTGDAARCYLTMATLKDKSQGLGESHAFRGFFASPYGYLQMIARLIGEVVKEMIQSRRAIRAGVSPRVERDLKYAVARAATNVACRELNTSLVIEEMLRGTPAIYVDYTDYDEVAHHSGPERPEALESLNGVDRVLGVLERIAAEAPRPYRIVVVSDHGQTLGATFLERYGTTLQDLIAGFMGGDVRAQVAGGGEDWGANAFLTEYTQTKGMAPTVARRAFAGSTSEGLVQLSPDEGGTAGAGATAKGATTPEGPAELIALVGGNIANVYFPRVGKHRATLEELEALYPGVVDRLANHPGIGLVMVRTATRGTIAVDPAGRRSLADDTVEGVDPTPKYGPQAVASLKRLDSFENVGDLVVLSLVDPDTDEVAAFEEQVGSHGGMGGWQTQAVFLHPADMEVTEQLVGSPAVHWQLRRWMESMGHTFGPVQPPA